MYEQLTLLESEQAGKIYHPKLSVAILSVFEKLTRLFGSDMEALFIVQWKTDFKQYSPAVKPNNLFTPIKKNIRIFKV